MSAKLKTVHSHGPSNINLDIFVCSFDVCRTSEIYQLWCMEPGPVVTHLPANAVAWDNQCALTKRLGIEPSVCVSVMSSIGI